MNRIKLSAFGCIVALLTVGGVARAASPAPAGDGYPSFGIGAELGTLGWGPNATLGLTDAMSIRGQANFLSYGYDGSVNDLDYDFDVDFQSQMLLLDIHPFMNGFRMTAGAVFNQNEITMDATPTDAVEIGDNTYDPEAVGTLHGTLDFEDVAPYFGIGYGYGAGSGGHWNFLFDLGVIVQPYDVTLTSDGPFAQTSFFQDDLQKEAQDVEDELNRYKIYPVLAFGVSYRF